jgi:hypothetical protein
MLPESRGWKSEAPRLLRSEQLDVARVEETTKEEKGRPAEYQRIFWALPRRRWRRIVYLCSFIQKPPGTSQAAVRGTTDYLRG